MNVETICGWVDFSRQAYYQQCQRDREQAQIAAEICEQVQAIRQRHPRLGGRKLLNELGPWLAQKGYQLGRDAFFDLLRANDLLIEPKRRQTRTTWAGHWRCPNLLVGATLTAPHQAWVSDITYLRLEDGFCYLTLITDAYSRCIVGAWVSDSLATEGSLKALRRALAQRPDWAKNNPLIHHSDHGVQFTDKRFRAQLKAHGVRPSMGVVGDCYDNALAERMNGILKLEYGLDGCFSDLKEARQAVAEAVYLYNFERPHLALNYLTPYSVHTNCLHNHQFSPLFCKLISGLDIRSCQRSALARIWDAPRSGHINEPAIFRIPPRRPR